MRNQRLKVRIIQVTILTTYYLLLTTLIGCDAFVRKFTRKPKKEPPKEELVLAPEEYKSHPISKQDLYLQYFLFWKSWHDELINSLSAGASHKKQIYCVNEALKNLEEMRPLLDEEKQQKLDIYINQLKDLKGQLTDDLYGSNISVNHLAAERIRRSILREFTYNKISKDISYGDTY